MRGHHDDVAGVAERPQALNQNLRRIIVKSGEWFVEQDQARVMQERTLKRQALSKPARKRPGTVIRAVGQARARQRIGHPDLEPVEPVQPPEEAQVLARSQVAIEIQIVAEDTDLPPERIARLSHRVCAIPHPSATGSQESGEDGNERGLTGAIRAEQTEDFALLRLQRDVRERPPPPVMPRDVINMDRVEVDTHGKAHTRRRTGAVHTDHNPQETKLSPMISATQRGHAGRLGNPLKLTVSVCPA